MTTENTAKFPGWFAIVGLVAIIGASALAGRLIWEQTVWTWATGPTMVGFSLVHGDGAPLLLPLLLSPVLLIIWLVPAVIITLRHVINKRHISKRVWLELGVSILVMSLLLIPYGSWQWLFAKRLAHGPYANRFLVYAAARGELGLVKALQSNGASVKLTDREGRTPLHLAAAQGHVKVIEYLISKGANVNAVDRFGDSPLELAVTWQHADAAKLLSAHGAQRYRGDDATRNRVIKEIVLEDM